MKRMNTNYPETIAVINENPSIQKASFEPAEDDWFTAGEQWVVSFKAKTNLWYSSKLTVLMQEYHQFPDINHLANLADSRL